MKEKYRHGIPPKKTKAPDGAITPSSLQKNRKKRRNTPLDKKRRTANRPVIKRH